MNSSTKKIKNNKARKEVEANDDAILEEAIKCADRLRLATNESIIPPSLDRLPYSKIVTKPDYRKRYFTSFAMSYKDVWTEFTDCYMNNDIEKNTLNCSMLLQIVDRMKSSSTDPIHQEIFSFLSFFIKIQITKFSTNPALLLPIPDHVLHALCEQNESFERISPTDTTNLLIWSSQLKDILRNISTSFEPSTEPSAIVSKCYFDLGLWILMASSII